MTNEVPRGNQFFFDAPQSGPVTYQDAKKYRGKKLLLNSATTVLISAIVGAGIGAATSLTVLANLSQNSAPVVVNNTAAVNWVTGATAAALPSVVTLSVSGGGSAGSGSGIFLTSDGYILTNTHVVTLDGTSSNVVIEVQASDGRIYKGRVVGTDPTNDLAVVKVSGSGFAAAKFADSSKLNVGDPVAAIGAPLGLESTVTTGIVSALNRTIQVANSAVPESETGSGGLQFWTGTNGQAPINIEVIQTDAAINPGNSGGALVNQQGQVIGVNVAIATAGSGSGASGQSGSIGVGFSIPSNIAKRIANELMKSGKASHGLLGAMVADATSSTSSAALSSGAKVESLTAGGAAQKAGLKKGDVVVAVDGTSVRSASELTSAIRALPAGATAVLSILRGGVAQDVTVVLGDLSTLQ
jgi:putative serine protease PepD